MKKVIVIEDNSDIRDNLCELLELEGYEVLFASNGKMGISMVMEHKPDIILCDILMTGANGYEVLKKTKDNPETSHVPFVFLSASAEKLEVEAGLGAGADGYISKPFEVTELLIILSDLLRKK